MYFEIVGPLAKIEVIAEGASVRVRQLRERYGGGRWRRLKGIGTIGRVSHKIKRFLD